jgi:acetyltransferase-like isoleucine patch superfamily enzyme
MADAYATRPIGGVSEDYVSYLGSYYFIQNPKVMVISANRDYVALSNQEGTIHSLRFVWAGLLRNAAKIVITITDDTTGEVIFETVDYDVRKSYGDGGSIYPANVEIEFDTMDYNLANNTEYTVKLVGYMDYGNGGLETNERNVFEFPLVVDFQAPTVTDVEYYYEYDKTMKKNRLYAKVGIFDNHFTMSSQLGYITTDVDEEGNSVPAMKVFSKYMTPVYSQRNSTTYVTYELTDHIYTIKEEALNANSFVLTVYDYALNMATYEIGLPDNYVDFYFDSLEEGLTLSPNEVFSLEPLVYPNSEWAELLEFSSSKLSVVRVVNNKLVATGSGMATVKVRDPSTNKSITFKVTVLKEGDEGYRRYDKPVADIFKLIGYTTKKAYFMVDSNEKKLGDTGDVRFFDGSYSLSMYPSESVALTHQLDAYFPNDTTVTYETSNENIVEISNTGVVTAKKEGFASVSVRVMMDGKSTYYTESVTIEVKDPYVYNGGILNHYYGNGGLVSIPADLSLTEIGAFAFSNFDYVTKTPEELLIDDTSISKQWYIGENTITKVIIPEGVKKINSYAFAQLTALEEVVLPSTLESIEYGAFYGCSKLQKITFSGENNCFIINQNAFENCDLQGTIDLTGACVISDYAFAGNPDLKGIITDDSLLSIGQYAFAGCKSLKDVTITSEKVKYGAYAFTGCKALTDFYVNASVLPEGMFYECDALTSVSIGPDVNDIGPFAFRSTKVEKFDVASGNKSFKVYNNNVLLSADGTSIIAVAPTVRGEFTSDQIGGAAVTVIGKGAFSHNIKITSVVLPNVTVVGEYGFGSSTALKSVTLGELSTVNDYGFFETAITQLPAFAGDVSIGKYAFSHTKLTSVTIPDGMTLAEGVFSECVELKTVVIGNNVTIGDYAFSVDKDNCFKIKSYDKDGEKYFYYEFVTQLSSLTIGDNVVIGKSAFSFATNLKKVTLGENVVIGDYAFYNNSSLEQIDLSKVLSIGDYAFSGDEYNVCLDENMSVPAVSKDGYYITQSHASKIKLADLSNATSVGKYAFALCEQLREVILGVGITEIPDYAFASCDSLAKINLENVVIFGDYALQETRLLNSVNLSAAVTIGKYAFVNGEKLTHVTLNPNGCEILEGAFCYNEGLKTVENLQFATMIDKYAFAYTGLTDVDLSAAVTLGDFAFMKEDFTPFSVKLGNALNSVGDNPFAMCLIQPFSIEQTITFNGIDYVNKVYTYDISDSVKVIDGSLYCKVNNGLELIVYAGTEHTDIKIADGTVRITGYAFAGSDAQMVTLPYTVGSIGHKAFFGCDDLKCIVFTSFDAPILEEEFDPSYYESFEHIPGSGNYGNYTDYEGNEVSIIGMGMIPYYMWNANSGQYSNVFYGANFIDYVGYVTDKLTMVRPVNGQHYDTYILDQYFDLTINGAAGADDTTLAAIAAINAIPERVTYEHKSIVEAARAAYNKVATKEQQSLVTNYDKLVSAEQRITALTPVPEETPEIEEVIKTGAAWLAWVVIVLGIAGVVVAVHFDRKGEKKSKQPQQEVAPVAEIAEIAEVVAEDTEEVSTEVVESSEE